MNRKIPFTGRKFIAGILCFSFLSANSQELSSINTTEVVVRKYDDGQTKAKLEPLRNVLKVVESHYNIYINFDDKVIANKFVDEKLVQKKINSDLDKNAEKILDHLLKPLALEYDRIKDNIYLIHKKIEIQSLPKKAGSNVYQQPQSQTANNRVYGNRIQKININRTVQENIVRGRVVSEEGEALPGVNIVVKGTLIGTITDNMGMYSLNVEDPNATLVFSFIGYTSEEIPVNGRSTINMTLVSDIRSLNEVVVIGYTTTNKSELASSVTTLKSKEITGMATTDVRQTLQGKISGVQVVNNNGVPGSGARIIIRGVGSFANPDPLYVVDGIMGGDINSILPQDIESITVLKDAATTAIYGSGAANGVVIITTKSGKKGKMSVSYDGSTGFSEVLSRYDLLNASQYVDLVEDIQTAGGLEITDKLRSQEVRQDRTDWQDAIFRRGIFTQHSLNLNGASENVSYSISGGYTNEESTIIDRDFRRANFMAKLNETFGRFQFTQNLRLKYDQNDGNIASINEALRMPPYLQIHDKDNLGGYSRADKVEDLQDANNPYNIYNSDYKSRDFNLNLDLSGQVQILKSLTFKTQGRLSAGNFHDYNFNRPVRGGNFVRETPDMNENFSRYYHYIIENFLNFDQTFGDHTLNVVAGNTYNAPTIYNSISLLGSGFTNDNLQNIGLAESKSIAGVNVNSGKATISYFGRASYSYKNKYIFNASLRRDASSVFGENYRAGVFPGFGVAWNLSEESFMENVPYISDLKFRASYGKTGNDNIRPFLTGINVFRGWQKDNIVYSFGDNESFWRGATISTLPNPFLRWEETTQMDVGLDLGFFNNKLNLVLDYYQRDNKDLLIETQLPASTGLGEPGGAPRQWINAASMINKGFEAGASYSSNAGDFTYNINLNATYNINEVTALGTASNTPINSGEWVSGVGNATRTDIGHPLSSYYGYVVERVAVDQQDVDRLNESAATTTNGEVTEYSPGLRPGDFVFKDVNNDGFINPEDRTYIGNPAPRWQYGGVVNLGYKGFDLGLNFMGLAGVEVVNGTRYWLEGMSKPFNQTANTLRRWQAEGDVTDMPAAGQNSGRNLAFSTWYVENGNYFRLKNITLGYSLPAGLLSTLTGNTVSVFRVYGTVQNALTITKYSGYDPEISAQGGSSEDFIFRRGIDNNQIPNPITYRIGVQVTF